MDKQVPILCDEDDKNLDTIAQRAAVLYQAAQNNSLVAVSCSDKLSGDPIIMLAVMTRDDENGYAQYAPIGELYYPADESYMQLIPPNAAIAAEESSDVQH